MVDFLVNLVKNITGTTADVVSNGAKFTAKVIGDTANLAADVVGETAKLTASTVEETAKLTANVAVGTTKLASTAVGATFNLLNLKQAAIQTGKDYLLDFITTEDQPKTLSEGMERNFTFAFCQMVFTPLERIRVLMQLQGMGIAQSRPYYSGIFDCFFKELRVNGMRVLFRGGTPFMAYNLIHFNLYDFRTKTILNYYKDRNKAIGLILKHLYLYDLLLLLISHPTELLGTRFAFVPHKRLEYSLYKKYFLVNPFELYKGFSANFLMLNLNYALLIPLSYYLNVSAGGDDFSFFIYLLGVKFGIEYLTHPLEVIKRRFMIQGQGNTGMEYKSITHAIRTIYINEHINGFFKGAWTKIFTQGSRYLLYYIILSYIPR